jgi:hypothetical protein
MMASNNQTVHTEGFHEPPPSRKNSVSLPEILRDTTLEEFLQAIERVKAMPEFINLGDESQLGKKRVRSALAAP